jgi:hypothetical protein
LPESADTGELAYGERRALLTSCLSSESLLLLEEKTPAPHHQRLGFEALM